VNRIFVIIKSGRKIELIKNIFSYGFLQYTDTQESLGIYVQMTLNTERELTTLSPGMYVGSSLKLPQVSFRMLHKSVKH
jgi:hypothetical protein